MIVYIPDTMKEHENDLRFVFELMIRKLDVNRHKGWLKGVSIDTLMKGMMREIDEVLDAIKSKDQMSTVVEAADVANYALLLGIFSLRMSRDEFVKNTVKDSPLSIDNVVIDNRLSASFNGA